MRGMGAMVLLAVLGAGAEPNARPFVIRVVDEATGRGVPLVELMTVNHVQYVTDSAGVVAFSEPGLMGQPVYFHVKSHGYEHAKDGFGYRGKALTPTEGGSATLKLKRINIAERLYRVTGEGVYRDSVLAGLPTPVREPLLNAKVFGSDSVIMAPFRGKLRWFWGDTNRPSYPLGNFHVPGAASLPPSAGGLDPDAGIDLTYYVDETGFAKPTAKLPGDGPTWLFGLAVVPDSQGNGHMVAGYSKIKPPLETYEQGVAAWNEEKQVFEKVAAFPLKSPLRPTGHTVKIKEAGVEYVHFTTPFPLTRVRARYEDFIDASKYEGYTCFLPGGSDDAPKVDRGPDGRARYAWRANAPLAGPAEQAKLIRSGQIKADEGLLALRDADTGKAVTAHGGTVFWNEHRQRWVAVILESFGTSLLGEIWFAEADTPLGPWVYARKIVTHDKYSFYNPRHHHELDKDGGRVIFFEGTYTTTFSGNSDPTPRYDYNQIMYKLDLDDPRLNLPVAVYRAGGKHASGAEAEKLSGGAPPVFFALERPAEGAAGLMATETGFRLASPETAKLFAAPHRDGQNATVPLDSIVPGAPAVAVWPSPALARRPAGRP